MYFVGDLIKVKNSCHLDYFRNRTGLVTEVLGRATPRDNSIVYVKVLLNNKASHVFSESELEIASRRRTHTLNGVGSDPISSRDSIFDEDTELFSASPKDFQKGYA